MSISVHPDTPQGRTLDASGAAAATPQAGKLASKIRSRLFTKYVALFVAVVGIALLSNGIFEVFLYYREHKAALIRIQHEQAEAAAAKISQFIKEIESQLGWTTQLPWSAGSIEQRRFDALRLLRQVPAITELAQVDSTGKERLRVSRLAMDVLDSGLDLSQDPKFTQAVANKVYYGPVYFRRESEPYMTLALAGTRKDAGVSIAEVNLKLIWDVVSQIKVGEHGHAYVVGEQGRLIAHPDISLVLRNTDMSKLVQVQAARAGMADPTSEAMNIQGQEVLTASAPIAPLGWTMFVELPVEEAYASLYLALQRLAIVLAGASIFAVLAGMFLARRMVVPIQALRAGAERIGAGDFSQRINIKTGDELEGLANQFNDMGARLQESYADLENKVEQRTAELSESLQHQTATSDVLQVISRSPGDLNPVFQTILERATKICDAKFGLLLLFENGSFRCVSVLNLPPAFAETFSRVPVIVPPSSDPLGRLASTHQLVHVTDVRLEPDYLAGFPPIVELAELGGARTMLLVPMLREDNLDGVIAIFRQDVRFFTDKQIDLVTSFASQGVIAIENTRLLSELRQRTGDLTESLQHQTATSEVLQVISSSPAELEPVFQTILARANDICDAQFGNLFLYEGGGFRLASILNLPTPFAETFSRNPIVFPPPTDPLGRLALSLQPVHVADARQEPDYLAGFAPIVQLVELGGARTVLLVPMLKENRLVGAIAIFRQAVRQFTGKQIDLVTSFANQAVIAIENARLLNELRERTDDLSESLQQQTATSNVLKVISRSAFDLDSVMNTLARSARELCGSDICSLFLRDGDRLVCRGAAAALDEHVAFMKNNPVEINDDSHMGRSVLTGTIANIGDFENDTHTKLRKFQQTIGFKALLLVPLMREGRGVGVFALVRNQVGDFTARQIELVQGFADQAVIAIENVRLFDEVQERTRELSLSLDELRTAQDRLVQTEKLASLGQLTAGIAHEIKNPLNFVNNFSALSGELIDELNDLLKSTTLDDKTREEIDELTHMLKGNLEKVVQHGKRADSIVKNMLLHSREGSGEHRPADINAIVEESLNLAYHGARAEKPGFNITLQRRFDAAAGMIDLYPQEITRVFLNLISNGFYAANKRKETGEEGFEPVLSATTKNLGNSVEIRIRDNGTGIPLEVKEKMFNPFFTTKPAGEGTGLGLSMSHDIIVKQHGGKIDVDTEPGVFTEFIIVLPRAGAALGMAGGKK